MGYTIYNFWEDIRQEQDLDKLSKKITSIDIDTVLYDLIGYLLIHEGQELRSECFRMMINNLPSLKSIIFVGEDDLSMIGKLPENIEVDIKVKSKKK